MLFRPLYTAEAVSEDNNDSIEDEEMGIVLSIKV
jgi:hypothetical protein